jgi:hypothetical protein
MLALVGGAGFAVMKKRSQQLSPAADAPAWPPMREPTTSASAAASSAAPASSTPAASAAPSVQTFAAAANGAAVPAARPADAAWVLPVNGECPPGYPVKGNDSSKIFHVPGGRSYDRTVPERCYANADDAIADGYRAAKA